LGSDLAPYDHFQAITNQGSEFGFGGKVYLAGIAKLPAGEYTKLPAHYALLPGAFLVTPQVKTQDQAFTIRTIDGLSVVAGYNTVAGTETRDSRSSGFRIESGADVRKNSEYEEHLANDFFTARAQKNETALPILPKDSGQISIIAQNKLILDSQFMVDAESGGRGAIMDITADKINVVNQFDVTPTLGTLEVLASDLSELNIDSLFLGGTRTRNVTTGNTDLTVGAQSVVFSAGSKVQVSDMIAAATDQVKVEGGAELTASGKVNSGDSRLNLSGDGALLRISGDKQVTLNRANTSGAKGDLIIAAGSRLSTSESMLLDASKSTTLEGDILMNGGSLNLSASAINMGEIPGTPTNALNLSNQKLLNITVDELVLNSRGTVSFYGNVGQVDGNNNPILGADGLQTPVKFDRLVLNAAGFSGFGSPGQAARLQANSVVLANPFNAAPTSIGTGQGRLDLLADNFTQGSGTFAVNGFNSMNVSVNNAFSAVGTSAMNVASDVNLNAGYLTTTGGSSFKLDASGHALQVSGGGNPASIASTDFGGAMEFIADTVAFDAKALLPSGKVGLQALTGDVLVGAVANIDLAGRAVKFADTFDYTPGGLFTVRSDNGSVSLAAGSKLDLSTGGGSAVGGNLILKAPKQTVTLAGSILASAGSAEFDLSNFGTTSSFDGFMAVLKNAGISGSIYFRSRDADIIQSAATDVTANKITLAADKGAVTVFGQLHADSNGQGGEINIYAGDKVTLENGSVVTAKGAKGGSVLLSSLDNDKDNLSGIDLKAGSQVNVSGNRAGIGGEITLRALRDGNGINIQPIAGNVAGYRQIFAEGVKKYIDADGFITGTEIADIKKETDDYMTPTNMLAITNALGNGIRLKAGVQLDYDGDLTLMEKWNFVDWRYNEGTSLTDLPGSLALNATGNIALNASISDGFKDGFIYQNSIPVTDLLQTGDSWSYQVTAGSDLSAADRLTTNADKNLVIGSNVSVRTGSGDIKLASGEDIKLTDDTSTIYTAGKPTETTRYGTLNELTVGFELYGEYPVEGGDLLLKAGKNIEGAITHQFISPWLVRQGSWTNNPGHFAEKPTAWAVALGYTPFVGNAADSSASLFKQNVGSFGGGKVDVIATGDINDLSVMMPTTGKQIGEPLADPSDPNPASFDFKTNEVQVNGGGEMRVSAGGDIAGGAYFLGQGHGSLSADGAIKGGSQFTAGPQLVMGDAKIDLLSNKEVRLTAVTDPMIIYSGNVNFYTYGDGSAVNIKSLSGDVHLGADVLKIGEFLAFDATQKTLAQIYPGSLESTAFNGSVILDNEVVLYPSAKGKLNLLAAQDITASADLLRLGMSDADPALLPTYLLPVSRSSTALDPILNRIKPFGVNALAHKATPLHAGDNEPVRLVATKGDINNIEFNTAKKALIQTGRDFRNVSLSVQHPNLHDTTILNIGRDLFYTSDRSPDGVLNNNIRKIELAGPGELLVKTGRNIDLGSSQGISTLGDITYSGLADRGANVTVMTGLNGGEPDYSGFIGKYLQNNKLYISDYAKVSTLVTDFMRQRSGNSGLTRDQALAGFKALKAEDYLTLQPQLAAIILPVYMNEIRESGSASADPKVGLANKRGYDAIEALFPGTKWKGDLSLFFSKIQSVDGGGINLMVPGGKINAGLAVAFTGSKASSDLGIVAQKEGAVNAVVRDDFLVNQSRVFALGGDDITLWSSEGDIDAGKGAKSSIAAPPPIISFDESGNLVIEFPAVVSGSGIRTASTASGILPGDVFLFAPKGVVNAGEAGIGGNNVTISATAVLGANNIDVGGVSAGIPQPPPSAAAGLTGTSNLSAGVTQVAEASVAANNDKNSQLRDAVLGLVSVDILGFGECDPALKNCN
jgi:filamentous hemagglutinin